MRTAARHVILLTLVTTVLCADRAITALPAMNQSVAEVAGRVAAKLAGNFRRTARDYRSSQWKTETPAAAFNARPRVLAFGGTHFTFSPFQFRLPPPTV